MKFVTTETLKYFLEKAEEAWDWNGYPVVDNIRKENGYLTNLKKAGLIETFKEGGTLWIDFTDKGHALAIEHNIDIPN